MKRLQQLSMLAVLAVFFSFASCKGKDSDKNSQPSTMDTATNTPPEPTPAPVIVGTDDELKTGLTEALKDQPTLKGNVSDSVIYVSGTIKRSDWQRLMPTLNSLHPKKINSDSVTIK